MFVLVIARGYPTKQYPMNGIFEFDQARALAAAGCKVVYAAVDLRSLRRWRKWGVEHLIKDGVEIYAINVPLGRVPHSMLRFVGRLAVRALYRLILRSHSEPDVVHAHFLNMAETALALKSMSNSLFVMTEHSSMIAKDAALYTKWVKKYARGIYASYDKVIAVSPSLAEILRRNFNAAPVCVPNMLDSIFLEQRDKREHNEFGFIFIANLIRRKAPLECIRGFYDAFHQTGFAAPDGRKICLTLIGGGPLYADCEKMIKGLGITENVIMTGPAARDKVAEAMCASDCFVLPSRRETFGVVYIEAMACGLPVIATICGGPEHFVNETNGILIPAEDHDALVDAFKYILENQEKYNNLQIQTSAQKNFSPELISTRLINLYGLLKDNDKKN